MTTYETVPSYVHEWVERTEQDSTAQEDEERSVEIGPTMGRYRRKPTKNTTTNPQERRPVRVGGEGTIKNLSKRSRRGFMFKATSLHLPVSFFTVTFPDEILPTNRRGLSNARTKIQNALKAVGMRGLSMIEFGHIDSLRRRPHLHLLLQGEMGHERLNEAVSRALLSGSSDRIQTYLGVARQQCDLNKLSCYVSKIETGDKALPVPFQGMRLHSSFGRPTFDLELRSPSKAQWDALQKEELRLWNEHRERLGFIKVERFRGGSFIFRNGRRALEIVEATHPLFRGGPIGFEDENFHDESD